MKRLVLAVVSIGFGCAAQPRPEPVLPPAPPAETPAVVEPEPVAEAPAPPVEPDPEPVPSVDVEEPTFEPLKLSEEQLKRARMVQQHVIAAAAEYGVDPNLLNGVIWNESKFNPKARNRSGAKGLMQLMPKTGKAMAKRLNRRFRPYDPEFSVHAGALLLSVLLGKFDDDEELALFGYARGGGRVRRYQREGGEIPEGVTKFIARVRRAQRTFAELGFPHEPSA
ncbi:MAG: lytic transglycosylase domain-containing protein [Myxococcota bacterium]